MYLLAKRGHSREERCTSPCAAERAARLAIATL